MTSYHDISYEQCASKSMTSIIRTTHNGQKEGPLIKISHLKTIQPNATNFARTSHNGKKPKNLLRKSCDKILQQKPCDLIKKSLKGQKRMKAQQEISLRPTSMTALLSIFHHPASPELTLMHAFTSPPRHQPEPPTEPSNH